MNNAIVKQDVVDLSTFSAQEEGFSLAELKQIVYRKWKPALLVFVVAFIAVFLRTALQTPKYKSETQILRQTPEQQESATISPEKQALSRSYSITDLSTEIFVLRSHSMISEALREIKNRYPNISASKVASSLSVHQAIVNKIPTDVLVISYTDTEPERAKAVLEALGSTYIDQSLQKQRSQATNGIEFINAQLPDAQKELDEAAKAVRSFRQVHNLVDPDSSAVSATTVKEGIEQEINQTKIAIELNKKRTQELNRQLSELGQDSETLVASSVLGQDGVYQNLATQLKDVETQYNLGKVDYHDTYFVMEDLKSRQAELKQLLRERAEQVLGNSVSQTILDRVVLTASRSAPSLEAEITSVDNSGSEVSTEGSTLQMFANQQLELQREAATLQSQLVNLRNAKIEAETNFQNIPQLQQTYKELVRQVELKSEAYNYLLERKQELEIAEAEETAPWRILNYPNLPTQPFSPDIKQGLFQALIAAGFLGVATAFILQHLDQRVKQVEEVKQITRLPLLGIIPKVNEPAIDINIHTTKKSYSYYSSFTEGLRSLAMNLRYLMIESGRIKTLALTSSTSAEGKTTVTYNLGLVLAEFGLKILIVDADLRKPKIHKLAKLSNEMGLSDALTTEDPWSDFIQTSSVDNLDIITSGSSAPNPIALLNSNKMKELIKQWQESYDYVLIDTPPIGVIADAKSIANQVDSILFVAGIQRASRKAMTNALDILRNSQCNLAGVVANMVDPEFDYYAYSYYDSYYNQPYDNVNNDNHDDDDDGGIQNILQQFRRR